ncbi:MAG: CBS domain-containing protein [Oscillospiraceae bacterium]|nr:CBS domain-containing protein [Oscillospiraceae bacterium]
MKVSEIMSGDVVCVSPSEPVSYAARLMNRYNIGAVPVTTDRGQVIGIVTDRDIVTRCIAAQEPPESTPVGAIMTKKTATVDSEEDVREAVRIMTDGKVRRVPVVRGGEVVGIVSLGDVSALHSFDMEASLALSEISSNIKRV